MATSRETVLQLLEHYSDMKRQMEQLRYELEHRNQISPTEVIESMSFGAGMGTEAPTGCVSDKTMYIALHYQDKTMALNQARQDGLIAELLSLELKLDRLEHYVSLLERRQAEVIRKFYLEQIPLSEIGKQMEISPRTLRNIRQSALDVLTEMYDYSTGIQTP